MGSRAQNSDISVKKFSENQKLFTDIMIDCVIYKNILSFLKEKWHYSFVNNAKPYIAYEIAYLKRTELYGHIIINIIIIFVIAYLLYGLNSVQVYVLNFI